MLTKKIAEAETTVSNLKKEADEARTEKVKEISEKLKTEPKR